MSRAGGRVGCFFVCAVTFIMLFKSVFVKKKNFCLTIVTFCARRSIWLCRIQVMVSRS